MKLNPPANPNYAAVVVSLNSIVSLADCDNIVGAPILGYQAIVSRGHGTGDIGIAFTAETQLSEEFASRNNLFSHAEKNADHDVKGYLTDSGRVKALKLRGHRSDALFLPLSTLGYTGAADELKVGDVFDELNGFPICKKYELPRQEQARRQNSAYATRFARVDSKFLPEHYDTTRYWGNEDRIPAHAQVVVTQKLHGTSIRIGEVPMKRRLTFRDRIAQRFLKVPVVDHVYGTVSGSRKLIKYGDESDLWTEYGKRLEGMIPQGYVLYGELVGWKANGTPIQKNYTYNVPERTADLYVYRVAHVNPLGFVVDLSWNQVEEFCEARGLKTVPVLHRGKHGYINVDSLIDCRFHDMGYAHAVPLSGPKKLVDEGVCIRMDGLIPTTLKAKSPIFLRHETKQLDDETAVDIEAEQSIG